MSISIASKLNQLMMELNSLPDTDDEPKVQPLSISGAVIDSIGMKSNFIPEVVNSFQEKIIISGIFRGLLLDSGRFEFLDMKGVKHSGFISEELNEEQLIEYNSLLNSPCILHVRVHRTTFKTGNNKTVYELLNISIP